MASITTSSFETRVAGKWVLAGEHAVLRGAPAIALPHPEYSFFLKYQAGDSDFLEVYPPELRVVLQKLLARAEEWFGKRLPPGRIEVQNQIPAGAGLGSSAALCVATYRMLAQVFHLAREQELRWATELEHEFHGKSSGMDVAAVSMGVPILFYRQTGAHKLEIQRLPRFTFHDSGVRSSTLDCIQKVEELGRQAPELAQRFDLRMAEASELAHQGLKLDEIDLVASAMDLAQSCFEGWNLVSPQAQKLAHSLRAQGAKAVKMTGAGWGGYLVALWD